MKTLVAVAISLIVGFVIGSFLGYRYSESQDTNWAMRQMMEQRETSEAYTAGLSMRAIGLMDSGEDKKAIRVLSFPIANYYETYAWRTSTNEERLKLCAWIDGMAGSNQIVAAEISKWVSNKPAFEQLKK
jgi:hypothetical protein